MSTSVGKREIRVDAFEKASGRAKFTDDLIKKEALVIKVVHAKIAHGYVKAVRAEKALAIEGVLRVFTGFDTPKNLYCADGHPWSMEPGHAGVQDRLMLHTHVRYYGDDVACVVAENEVAAVRGVRAVEVEYDELPFVLDVFDAMKEGAPVIHENVPDNIVGHSNIVTGDYESAVKEPGLIKVEGWYETPAVQHCHIENCVCEAYMESGRITVVSSTQIPHIVRRIVGQALGRPWGDIRVIKPYIGGGFGNRQDANYEPLCAWVTTKMGGCPVKLECTREETFENNHTRHAMKFHIISWVRKDGTIAARKVRCYSNQGAYASHGHGVVAKGLGAISQIYPCRNFDGEAWTVYTNRVSAGAMRGYGIPQAMFADESNIDDIARALNMDPVKYRQKNLMPVGYKDDFSGNCNYFDSFNQCVEIGKSDIHYQEKREQYARQSGPIRRGVGCAVYWYNTAVWPIAMETSCCRMILNQDGSVSLQMGETEIGQGRDTVYSQMAADTIGVLFEKIHIVTTQDTDVTPYGQGAYASRQTYIGGFSIQQTGKMLKDRILEYASKLTGQPATNMDIIDGWIIRVTDQKRLMTVEELSMRALYSETDSRQLTAESSCQIRNNAYSFGCTFAEVEVNIPMCEVKILNMVNVHDCGRLINPGCAEAQVHGGMSMAIGYALSEQLLYDKKTGRILNGNLLDYKLSTVMDHPRLKARFVENYEPTSPFGTKSLGEPPACSGAPAIRNAILNATGTAINRLPMKPQALYEEFSAAGLIRDEDEQKKELKSHV